MSISRPHFGLLRLTSDSDILAELDIPPSGIQEVQEVVPYPKGPTAPGDLVGEAQTPDILLYYSAQLYMRKLLNDIQKELYQESKSSGPNPSQSDFWTDKT